MVREIRINPVLNGWVVTVGCQVVVFNDLQRMTQEIGSYYLNPEETEKRYQSEARNKTLCDIPTPAPCMPQDVNRCEPMAVGGTTDSVRRR